MDTIAVVLAADDRYAQHAAVAAASILDSSARPEQIHLYILDDGITEENRRRIEKTIQSLHGQVTFLQTDSSRLNGFVSGHLSKAAYLRLLIPDLLPQAVHKAIYFDTDLVVLDDISRLWNLPLDGQPVGAVCDFGIMGSRRMMRQKAETLGLAESDAYFNSGVMVMDLAQWRERGYGRAVMDCVTGHSFRHHDQDGLNKIFYQRWQALPLRWNVIPPVFSLPLKVLLRKKLRVPAVEALRQPAVFHWAGRYKPWEFSLSTSFNLLYYTYLQCTAFKNMTMPQPGKDMNGKSIRRQEGRMKWAHFWTRVL